MCSCAPEGFQRPGWSLGVGLALGLGMLVKPPFAAYVLPPLAWSAWLALRAPDRGARRSLGLALGVALVLALPWYGPRLAGLPMQIFNRSYTLAIESPPTLSVSGLLFYPRTFVPQFGILASLLSLWGLWAVRRFPRPARSCGRRSCPSGPKQPLTVAIRWQAS